MNIFDVLSKGKSRLHEPAISAMLGYLLDTHKDHGLGDRFLRAFMLLLQKKVRHPIFPSILDRPFIHTEVTLEEPVKMGKSTRNLDIQVSVLNGERNEDLRVVVENKIKVGAANPKQLNEYYQAVLEDADDSTNLVVVFLTPKTAASALRKEYTQLRVMAGHKKVWLYWNDSAQGILGQLQDLLRQEAVGAIAPINEYLKHTLKAFILHVEGVVAAAPPGTHRVGQDIGDVVEDVAVRLRDKSTYRIVRRNSGQIQVYQDGEKVTAKDALRKVIRDKKLAVPTKGNTRRMGRSVLDTLRKLKP